MIDPITVCLVGCSKTKSARKGKARTFYRGGLFEKARAYAEDCDDWRILSARYGLVEPEQILEPYDDKLAPKDAQQWGQQTANSIVHAFDGCGPYKLVILAGEVYAHPVMIGMRATATTWRGDCVDVTAPLRGLGIGKRLAWLKAEMATVAA